MSNFIETLDQKIIQKKKMTSKLYQVILDGKATKRLLQNFIIHRYPIKDLWTRHLMSIASRVDDYDLRRLFLENAFEEETGYQTNSDRHLETFVNVGICFGLAKEDIVNANEMLEETKRLCEFNWDACNNTDNHFTCGVASVIYLMEGQPPIINSKGESMEIVIKETYGLPNNGVEFFTHHASSSEEDGGVSELEDEHALACKNLLMKYCDTEEKQEDAIRFLNRAIELRHLHFDAIYDKYYDENEPVFRYNESLIT